MSIACLWHSYLQPHNGCFCLKKKSTKLSFQSLWQNWSELAAASVATEACIDWFRSTLSLSVILNDTPLMTFQWAAWKVQCVQRHDLLRVMHLGWSTLLSSVSIRFCHFASPSSASLIVTLQILRPLSELRNGFGFRHDLPVSCTGL